MSLSITAIACLTSLWTRFNCLANSLRPVLVVSCTARAFSSWRRVGCFNRETRDVGFGFDFVGAACDSCRLVAALLGCVHKAGG